jgi:hypothetical protein
MSPPEKLPDNLWADIQDVTQRMAAFLVQAQHGNRVGGAPTPWSTPRRRVGQAETTEPRWSPYA